MSYKIGERIYFILHLSPVEFVLPIMRQFFHVPGIGAIVPAGAIYLIGPTCIAILAFKSSSISCAILATNGCTVPSVISVIFIFVFN